MQTLYLAGGCFWGVQKYFDQFRGVKSTEAGYANGPEGTSAPDYEEVCTGVGFAETVKVVFDPAVLPAKKLLEYFFLAIDPLAVNRQGPDVGVQYRTGIYYEAQEEESLLPDILAAVAEQEGKLGEKLATEVAPLRNYYPAETWHQDYLKKNPYGYCHLPKRAFFVQYAIDKAAEEGVE